MKKLFEINKWLIITTLLLYLTFWGGILAHIFLGVVQIIMSIAIMIHFAEQTKLVKNLFISYVLTTIVIVFIFKSIKQITGESFELAIIWMITTILLAIFHLYVTYKIKQS